MYVYVCLCGGRNWVTRFGACGADEQTKSHFSYNYNV